MRRYFDRHAAHFDRMMTSSEDPARAVAEAVRVLRPGGRLILLEHGLSSRPWLARAQRLVEPAFQRWKAEHVTREHDHYVLLPTLREADVQRAGRGDLVYRIVVQRP